MLDVNTGVGEHNLQYARPNLSLLFGDERKDAFDAIREPEKARKNLNVLKERFEGDVKDAAPGKAAHGQILHIEISTDESVARYQQQRHLGSTENCHAIGPSIVVDAPLPGAQAGGATVLFKNAVPCRQKDCFDEVPLVSTGQKIRPQNAMRGRVAEARKNQVGHFRVLEICTE